MHLKIDVSKRINVLRSIFVWMTNKWCDIFYVNTLKKKKKKKKSSEYFAEIFKTEQILLSSSAFVPLWQVTNTRIIHVKCEIRREKIKNNTLSSTYLFPRSNKYQRLALIWSTTKKNIYIYLSITNSRLKKKTRRMYLPIEGRPV